MSAELEAAYEVELERHNKVIELISRGKTAAEIERATSIPPRVQREIYKKFEHYATNDFQTQQRARTIVAELDVQYTYLIRKLEALLEDAELNDARKDQREILKELANVNKMRADQLQKAGILSSDGIGDKFAEWEHEKQTMIKILNELGSKFPDAAKYVAKRIGEEFNEVVEVR